MHPFLPESIAIRRETVTAGCEPADLLDALTAESDPVLLESSARDAELGRYSIIACRPLEVLTLDREQLHLQHSDTVHTGRHAVWGALEELLSPVVADQTHYPYPPGWLGYVGYEFGRLIENLPSRAQRVTPFPDMRLGFYDSLLTHDAADGTWNLLTLVDARTDRPLSDTGHRLRRMVQDACSLPGNSPAVDNPHSPAAPLTPVGNFTPQEYRQAVQRCIDYIAAGDIFQVNLSQRLTLTGVPDPLRIYRVLRERNPAWYAGFLTFRGPAGEGCSILSSSPELFLRVRGRHVLTRPIKGTRPRVGDPEADRRSAASLQASEKDRAELAMIIDLLRNDIGKVCQYNSVRVTEPCRLEEHPTVYHLVGMIEGLLREEVSPADLLRATFPGGSITGAPKIRAMEIIDELEPVARGVYTGCIGHVGVNGNQEWNIAIRTIVCHGRTAHVQAGGGIVADSTPHGEYRETLDKARALLESIARAAESR